jgi:16S rRNA (guanine527-N7)-methyltransferase
VNADPAGRLREGLSLLEVPDAGRVAGMLERFLLELRKWNPRFGLVKAGAEELVVKHVLDSLSAWRSVAEEAPGGTVLDVGSGAGFPGIPLAVALPSISFSLLERSAKRAAFLLNCAVLLELANVKVIQADLDRVSGSFDAVTFRAVAPLDRLLEGLKRAGVRFRVVLAYKGRASKVREELARISEAGIWLTDVRKLDVPFLGEERNLVLVKAARR